MTSQIVNAVKDECYENISNSVSLIMRSLQTIQNTKKVINENEIYIEQIQSKQIS